ncbi:MAG: hypothetical protein FWD92_01880 [Methanomassiliicoccaceae archaeon]|nr:hypothetical protein [Methanomassiliicoccaceae archaeon]
MMEFTLSRVCMGVCGLILLAAVVVPVTGMYEKQIANMESDASYDIASLIDCFYYSEMECMTINMSDILPVQSYIEIRDRRLTLTTENGEYRSWTRVTMISEEDTFGYGDIVRISKCADAVIFERLA